MDKIKETCDNCEHDNDSGQEYCGSCDGHTSNWVKARWILQETIDILQAENKKLKEQQLTEDELLFIITPKGLPPLPKHIRLAKKIIAKMKEKAE